MIYLRYALMIGYFVGLYLTLPLSFVPGGFSIACGVALLLLKFEKVSVVHRKVFIIFCAALTWVLTIPFSPDPSGFALEHLKSVALLMASTLGAFGLLIELLSWQRRNLARLFACIAGGLLFFTALEVFTPFRVVSDEIRSIIYAGTFVYSSDVRDIAISGNIRPKLFTQEPSHLAKALAVSISCAVVLSKNNYRFVIGLATWLIAYYLTGSPTLLLALGAFAAAIVFRNEGQISGNQVIVRAVLVVAPILGFMFIQDIASALPFSRAQSIANGEDRSFIIRSIGPAKIAIDTMMTYPISGSGIGGRELVNDIVLGVYQQFPGFWLQRFTTGAGYAGWGNAFFEIFTYSGIVISCLTIPALIISIRQYATSYLLGILLFFLVFNFDSGFASMRPWSYFAILCAAFAVAQNDDRRRLPEQARPHDAIRSGQPSMEREGRST